jgi:hypothetical protein
MPFRLLVTDDGPRKVAVELHVDHELEETLIVGRGPYVLAVDGRPVRLERSELAGLIAAGRELLERGGS